MAPNCVLLRDPVRIAASTTLLLIRFSKTLPTLLNNEMGRHDLGI